MLGRRPPELDVPLARRSRGEIARFEGDAEVSGAQLHGEGDVETRFGGEGGDLAGTGLQLEDRQARPGGARAEADHPDLGLWRAFLARFVGLARALRDGPRVTAKAGRQVDAQIPGGGPGVFHHQLKIDLQPVGVGAGAVLGVALGVEQTHGKAARSDAEFRRAGIFPSCG